MLEAIGEGGFGRVFVAEQRHPVRRKVAIKLLKPGMDSTEVLARFEAERQALAMMDHPNVAKVLDAGLTAGGRPYFAMEHVPGVSITDYADAARLSTHQRIELFIPVCQAVQHAHQKGIIHRDLKPSNILVTLLDGQAVPKVIDFGVAKALHAPLTDRTLHTSAGHLIGTPEYLSPEQAVSGGIDVDTRTDVYSLGVILYQLLTGTLPFESELLRGAGVDAMIRTIREIEPPKPSTRLSTVLMEPTGVSRLSVEDLAKRHRTDPRALARELRGDLDWITLKAMEKDRARRYATANGLAADLRRFLSGEPVEAGPPGVGYRLGKYARKYRTAVIAGGLVASLGVVSIVVISVLLVEAVRSRDQARVAEAQAARERDEARRARDEAKRSAEETQVQRALAEVSRGEAEASSELFLRIIGASNLISDVGARDRTLVSVLEEISAAIDSPSNALGPRQSIPIRCALSSAWLSMGRYSVAREQGDAALALATKHAPDDARLMADATLCAAHARYRLDDQSAKALAARGYELATVSKDPRLLKRARLLAGHVAPTAAEGQRFYREGLDAALAEGRRDEQRLFGSSLARSMIDEGRFVEGERLLRQYVMLPGSASAAPGAEPIDETDVNAPVHLSALAFALEKQGRPQDALPYRQRALEWNQHHLPADHPQVLQTLTNLRYTRAQLKQFDQVAALDRLIEAGFTEALARRQDYADIHALNTAKLWRDEWQLDRAAEMIRRVLDRRSRTIGADHPWTAGTRGDLAETLVLNGKFNDAVALIDEARPVFVKKGDEPYTLVWLERLKFDALLGAGRTAEARALVSAQADQRRARNIPDDPELRWCDNDFALIDLAEGRFEVARQSLVRLLASYAASAPEGNAVAEAESMLGGALAGLGQDAKAEPLLCEAVAKVLGGASFPRRKQQALQRLIQFYSARGNAAKAAEWTARLEDLNPASAAARGR